MTLRLVALMSVVLLLCLGAFGFLLQHSQDQVMQEVARTASAVGQATLRTFEFGPPGEAGDPGIETTGAEAFVWTSDIRQEAVPPPIDADEPGRVERIVRVEHVTDVEDDDGNPMIQRQIRRYHRQLDLGDGVDVVAVTCESLGPDQPENCVTSRGEQAKQELGNFFISIEDIRAESDSDHGVVLKFPGRLPAHALIPNGPAGTADLEIETVAGVDPVSRRELQLKIPGEFDQVFDSFRKRSMFMFLGVFLVGTVLSAGLATRFTRPIRKMDAGIRRLADGDLDVGVDVRGNDEIARLGQAFNEMTRKLRASRDRAREMVRREKLTALGRLAAGVAHDVRNPLHSIGLTLQHLHETCRPESGGKAEEFDRSLEIIRGEIRRLDQTVSNFLQFATNERRERQPVDLKKLLRETARLVAKEAEWRQIEVTLEIDPSAPEIVADAEAIRSSLLNLVVNSFEAMPDGGKLRLTLAVEGGELRLEVADDGTGVPEEDLEKVFDFAYTTRESGSGLGLAMVHQCIVEEHGGRVSLDSRPGEGTTVRLALPLDSGDGSASA